MPQSDQIESADQTRVPILSDNSPSDARPVQQPEREDCADKTRVRGSHQSAFHRESDASAKEILQQDLAVGIPYSEKFSVQGFVGQGGTSRVFLGFDRGIGREVALKELLCSRDANLEPSFGAELRERFEREIKITGQLGHPGIVPVYEAGTGNDGRLFYAMKYVKGKTLKEAVANCESLSPEGSFARRLKLLDHVIDVCDAVAFAHSREIIHRDIKPENIIIGKFGETVVIDWGLAKDLGQDHTSIGGNPAPANETTEFDDLTRCNSIFGTPRFMPPEQAGGQSGKYSDVYSLGGLLYFVLTSKPVYSGSMNEVLEKLCSDQPTPSPRKVLPFIPAELAAICEKAMAKDPTQRFADAHELAEQLHAYRDGRLISTYAYSRKELLRRFVSRNRSLLGSVAMVMIAVLAGAFASMNYAIKANAAQARANAALMDITGLSQMAIHHSQQIAEAVQQRLNELAADMDETARKLAQVESGSNRSAQTLLANLHSRNPNIDHFMLIDPDGVIQEYAPGNSVRSGEMRPYDGSKQHWIHPHVLTSKFGRVFEFSDQEWVLPVQSAIGTLDKPLGRLVGLLRPAEFLADILFSVTPSGKVRPEAWLMQDDGLIIYDNDPHQVGRNLYTDMRLLGSPSLQALGLRLKLEQTGIGYYSEAGGLKKTKVDRVTAWDSVPLNGDLVWKAISYFEYGSD